ncbi:MAG: hypothetical protein ACTHNP_01365 [Solirubrobacterales bacterium]
MRHLKIASLAGLTALILLAFVGVATAPATVLCKTGTAPCGAGWTLGAGDTIGATLEGSSHWEREGTEFATCTEGMFVIKLENPGSAAETVHGIFSSISIKNCTNTVDTVTNGPIEVHAIPGSSNGTLTGKAIFRMQFFGITCTYGGSGDLGTLTAGSTATLDVNLKIPKEEGGILCPSEMEWGARYTVTSPLPLFVTAS